MNSEAKILDNPAAVRLLGVPIHPVGVAKVHSFMDQTIQAKEKALILNVNIHAMNLAVKHPWLKSFFQKAQLIFCDGDGVRWALQLKGRQVPPKITYDRWFWQLSEFCEKKKYRLYFLGSRLGVAEAAAEKLKARYPELQVVGMAHGYFDHQGEESEKQIARINELSPEIVVLGFGMPLQEKWLEENWKKMNANIFLTGGAVFEVVSGSLKSPPRWIVAWQLEWFYRWMQQPFRRFGRYFIGIPCFFWRVLTDKKDQE